MLAAQLQETRLELAAMTSEAKGFRLWAFRGSGFSGFRDFLVLDFKVSAPKQQSCSAERE